MDIAKLPVIIVAVVTGLWIVHLVLARREEENLRLKKIPVGQVIDIVHFKTGDYEEFRRTKGKITERKETFVSPVTGKRTFSYSIRTNDGKFHLGHSEYCFFNEKRRIWEFHK